MGRHYRKAGLLEFQDSPLPVGSHALGLSVAAVEREIRFSHMTKHGRGRWADSETFCRHSLTRAWIPALALVGCVTA